MQKNTPVLVILLFIVALSQPLWATGLRPFDLSARAASLGGAFVTRTDNASSVYYNPAALAFSPGLRAEFNIYHANTTLTTEHPSFPKPYRSLQGISRVSPFVSVNIKDRLGFGIGAYAPTAMSIQWPEDWIGRSLSLRTKLNTTSVRPVIAVKISKFLSLGAGIDFISSDVEWKYDRIFTFQEGGSDDTVIARSESEVSAKGKGYVAGILIRLSDSLRIGGRYQTKVKLDLIGAHIFLFPEISNTPFSVFQETTSILTLPQEFTLGLMYSPLKNLTLQLDIQRINMSDSNKWEFNLDPEFYEEIDDQFGARPGPIKHGVDLNFRDTTRIMFGAEYGPNKYLAIRAGYSLQQKAVEDLEIHPVFPDLGSSILSFGIGYDGSAYSTLDNEERIGGFSLDLFFQYGFSPIRSSTLTELPVNYRASRWVLGIGVGFSFGTQ